MELSPLPIEMFPDALARHLAASSPPPMRMMAARGMVPAAPAELSGLLYQLTFDADEQIARAARGTLDGLPDDVIVAAGSAPNHPWVLHLLATVAVKRRTSAPAEAVLRNPGTLDDTFAVVAKSCSESITELIAANEVRVLRCPRIIESLFLNEHARQSTIDRLLDLAKRNKVSFDELHALQALMEDARFDAAAEAKAGAEKDARFRAQLERSKQEEAEEEARVSGLSEEEILRRREREHEDDEHQAKTSKNKQAEIANMSISEKIRLATLGSAADRDLLIRDGNRLVHMAAATSPKVQLRDIVGWSCNKQMPDTVITYIANHARYRRMYRINLNLANNPKTPLAVASKIAPSLQTKDLQLLAKNRNAHPMVRRLAKNFADQREQGRK